MLKKTLRIQNHFLQNILPRGPNLTRQIRTEVQRAVTISTKTKKDREWAIV